MAKKKKSALAKSLDDKTHIPFVDRIVNQDKYPVRPNKDGSQSSHLMAWASDDDGYFAYPTLQYMDGQFQEFKDPKYALQRNNVLRFDSAEEAEKFADGSWKEEYSFNYGGQLNKQNTQMKKNTSKKLPKDASGSMPYFLINSMGEIQEYALGGDLKDKAEMDWQSIAGMSTQVGEIGSDLLGGDTHISENRNVGVGDAAAAGVVKGAGKGLSVGANPLLMGLTGGLSAPIGAAVGAVSGGIIGGKNKKEEIEKFGEDMTRKYAGYEHNTTDYVGAYGGELPEMLALGGGVEDPPVTDIPEVTVTAPPTAPPTAAQLSQWRQTDFYNQSTNIDNPGAYSLVTDPAQLETYFSNYLGERDIVTSGGNRVWHDAAADKYVRSEFGDPEFAKAYYPKKQAPMPKQPKRLTATGAESDLPLLPGQSTDFQSAQPIDDFMNSPEQVAKREKEQSALDLRKTELANMSPEQRRLAANKLTPTEIREQQRLDYINANKKAMGGAVGSELELGGDPTEFNGNRHENGGIKIGKAEVEDGEIRVGDYVFSDRLTGVDGRTFAQAAKKITKKFEEYENDGPSMRTQNKMLEDLKLQNDQARIAKEEEEATMNKVMSQDYAAYGGMITKDNKGKYQVDKKDRLALLGQAKGHKMSYNKYIDSLYAYGGRLKDGEPDNYVPSYPDPTKYEPQPNVFDLYPEGLPQVPLSESTENSFDDNFQEYLGEFNGVKMSDLKKTADGRPYSPTPTYGNTFALNKLNREGKLRTSWDKIDVPLAAPDYDYEKEIIRELNEQDKLPILPTTHMKTAVDDGGAGMTIEDIDISKVEGNFRDKLKETLAGIGPEEKALLASNLPSLANLINSSKDADTTFDRVDLKDINLDQDRKEVKESIARGKAAHRKNVRGTATSAGEALGALSAGNAGLTDRELDALSRIDANEANTNIQIDNQEKLTNLGISNQEMIARQQDDALRDSTKNASIASMSNNIQGYIKDKSLTKENARYNKELMSVINSIAQEYKWDNDNGEFVLKYDMMTPKAKGDKKDASNGYAVIVE